LNPDTRAITSELLDIPSTVRSETMDAVISIEHSSRSLEEDSNQEVKVEPLKLDEHFLSTPVMWNQQTNPQKVSVHLL
jgi:hypothetical protein